MKIKGKQVFDFGNIGKPKAITVEAFRLCRMQLRVNADVVCQRFSAAKAQALVADAFTDFLGTRSKIPDALNVLPPKAVTAICNVEDTFISALDNQFDRDFAMVS